MKNNSGLIILLTVLVLVVAGFAGYWFFLREEANDEGQTSADSILPNPELPPNNDPATIEIVDLPIEEPISYTLADVAQRTGINGNDCWVVVDGTVYDMTNADNWANGTHTTSGGRANCGEDLTSVIGASPHGRSVLSANGVVAIGELQ